jgi:hypothetical protein
VSIGLKVTGGEDDLRDSLQPLFLIPAKSSSILRTLEGLFSSGFSSYSVDLISIRVGIGSGAGAVVLLDSSVSP